MRAMAGLKWLDERSEACVPTTAAGTCRLRQWLALFTLLVGAMETWAETQVEAYVGRVYPCSEAERVCLSHGRLLHAPDGNCYRVRERGPCAEGELFRLNKTLALASDTEEGVAARLTGTCAKQCVGARRPLAASGECRSHTWVQRQVCRHEWGLQVSVNVFGEWVCKCRAPSCAPPSAEADIELTTQPEETPPPTTTPVPTPAAEPGPGCCRAPDLSHPTPVPFYDDRLALFGFWVPCSEAEHACLRRGRVRVDGDCHALRTQGPCARGEELALDAMALLFPFDHTRARLLPRCTTRRCEGGRGVFLPAHGRCLPEAEVQRWLCQGKAPVRDEFGGWGCWRLLAAGANLSNTLRDDSGRCQLPPSASWY